MIGDKLVLHSGRLAMYLAAFFLQSIDSMKTGATLQPAPASRVRQLTLICLLLVLITSNGHADSSDSCQIEQVFARYQEAVLSDVELSEIKRYFAEGFTAIINEYISNVNVDENHIVIEMGYLSAARHAEHIYDHAGWIHGETGCLAIDSHSPTSGRRVNVVIEFTRENDEWRISNDFRATPADNEPWYFISIPNHQSLCLRHEWRELAEREVTSLRQRYTKKFVPSCDSTPPHKLSMANLVTSPVH